MQIPTTPLYGNAFFFTGWLGPSPFCDRSVEVTHLN
jgi:hypothetical protein